MPKSVVMTDALMQPIAHFSFGARAGDLIYIGATAGTDANRRLSGSATGLTDTTAQSAKMFANLDLSLKLLGGKIDDVVRVKSYITDWRDLPAYEAEYARYASSRRPSHSIVGTHGFPLPQATVETELLAILGGPHSHPTSERLPKALSLQPQGGVATKGQHYCVASPLDAHGQVIEQDPVAQSTLTFQNLAKILEASGLGLRDVVMLNVTLSDIRDFQTFEAVFRSFFRAPYPARSVQAASLERNDMLVQVESFAVAGGGRPVFGLDQPAALGDASPGVLAGDTLYIGAQLGVHVDGTFPMDIAAQVRAAWERIYALLAEAGMQPDDVIHTSNCLTDWRSYMGFNAGFGSFVSSPYPPRATVLAGIVDPRALVQIEALAHKEGRNATFIELKPR